MNVGELIEALKKYDRSTPVCDTTNQEIWFITNEPAYYDGCLKRVDVDVDKKFFNVKKVIITSEGRKLVLHSFGLDFHIIDDPDFPVEYDIEDEKIRKDWESSVEEWRQKSREIEAQIQKEETEKKFAQDLENEHEQ